MSMLTLAESILGPVHIVPLILILFVEIWLIDWFCSCVRKNFEAKTATIIFAILSVTACIMTVWILFFDGPLLFEPVW
jgi:hypothetical protein